MALEVTMTTRNQPYLNAAQILLRESGCTIKGWRSTMSGGAYLKSEEWAIEVPQPRGPISFGIFAHEVGHHMLHRTGNKQRWVQEVEAEDWALAQFDRFRLKGKDQYEARAAKHLAWMFRRAMRRKVLPSTIKEKFPVWWDRTMAYEADLTMVAYSRERQALDR